MRGDERVPFVIPWLLLLLNDDDDYANAKR